MIQAGYKYRESPRFRLLSDQQLDELHSAALEILRRTGVEVLDDEGLAVFAKAGAKVDGRRVRIPPHLVEWAIRAAPSQVVLCDRNRHPALYLERYNSYYGTGSDTHNIYDPFTGERRPTIKADVAGVARVCDYLPNISFVMCMGIAHDVTEGISDLHHFEAMVTNTTKPIVFTAWNLDNLKDIVEMAELVSGDPETLRLNPCIVAYLELISPLQLAIEPTQKLIYMAKKALPVVWTPGQVGGATSPVTVAGAVAQGNAEALAGLVLAQLVREGAPVIYGGGSIQMHMGTTVACYESPEFMLSVIAAAELAHYYKLPVWSYGTCSDAKLFDQQAAIGGTLWTLLAALSGGNLVHDVGYLESGLTTSFEQLVVADEVIGLIRRLMGGIEVSEETLALDTIDQVGPGGHYLGAEHTYRHFRETWVPQLLDWRNYAAWARDGKTTLGDRAAQKARDILNTYAPQPLAEELRMQIGSIVQRAEARMRGAER